MDFTKTLSLADVCIVVGRLTYGQQLERNALMRKFLFDPPKDAAPQEQDRHAAIWNFIVLATQTRSVEGFPFDVPHSGDSPEAFERKLTTFLETDHEILRLWINEVDDMSKPLAPVSQLPLEQLSEEQKHDPKSVRRGGKQKPAPVKP